MDLLNPYSLHATLQWLIDHGPRLLIILVALIVVNRLVHWSSRHIVQLVITRTRPRGAGGESEHRVDTLVSVLRGTAKAIVIIAGLLMILQELEVPVMPLLSGAAIAGLAIAFGSQNLIRDYFSGFMILLEDQYVVNDIVKIGDHTGVVERVTLRVTVLRDLEGNVHFIPNGSIAGVTNMSYSWSRALFEVAVTNKEDADRAMQILLDLSRELRQDPQCGPLILDDAQMLGVEALSESTQNIKFFIKTQPLKQWDVKREMLRRIKHRFEELGIAVPASH